MKSLSSSGLYPKWSRRAFIANGATAALSGISSAEVSAKSDVDVFGSTFGLGLKFSQGQPMTELPMLADLGIKWVRDGVGRSTMEPVAGRFLDEFPIDFRRRLEFYRKHRIGVVFLVSLSNAVAYPVSDSNPIAPYDIEAFAAFAVRMSRLMRRESVDFLLELGNEPHNSMLAKTLGGGWQGRPPAPWLDHYVAMVHAAVAAVKDLDPRIRLLTDDDMWVTHYWYLEAGLPVNIDGFAVHPYVGSGKPELTNVRSTTEWTRPFVIVDDDSSFRSAVRRLREQGGRKLGRTPEIWITEWGWPVGNGKGQISEEQLASYLPRAFILSAEAGVKALLWFSSRDAVDGPMGLIANDGRRRKSYFSFRTMSQQLGAFRLSRRVAGESNPVSGLQAFLFEMAAGRKLVAWNADNETLRLPMPASGWKAAVDAMGANVATKDGAGSRPWLPIDGSPLYIEGDWSDDDIRVSISGVR